MKNHVWVMGNYQPFHKQLQRESQLLRYKQYSELRVFTKIGHFLLTLIDMQNIYLHVCFYENTITLNFDFNHELSGFFFQF